MMCRSAKWPGWRKKDIVRSNGAIHMLTEENPGTVMDNLCMCCEGARQEIYGMKVPVGGVFIIRKA